LASKKDKILENAQRFVLKGQLDKAIKEYQQVVALEPKEIRYRQRLAELLVRDNRKEEAIVQYEDIGKHYAENSYFLKAIAIYKQVQRLSPGNTNISLTIASLNHQQGLIGNALAEYGQVLAQFEKDGNLKEALKVVVSMLAADAEQVAIRQKHAELLFATGSMDASSKAFSALSSSLGSAGKSAEAETVLQRMRQLFPEQQGQEPAGDLYNIINPSASDGFGSLEEEVSQQAEPAPDPFGTPDFAEPPDAFTQVPAGSETPAAMDTPGAFGAPWESDAPEDSSAAAVSQGGGVPDPGSAWEEEIELDLDDDPPELEVPATQAQGVPDFIAVPGPGEPGLGEVDPGEIDLDGIDPPSASGTDVDLHLDFSMNLDFDEEYDASTEAPLGPEPQAFELDLEEEGSLELSLPQEFEPSAEIEWSEELQESEESDQSDHEIAPLRGWDDIYPNAGDSDLDYDELESHYDLGIGYKEMGLYNGAIKEFDVAAGNPQRRVDCLTLQAICYREKGEPAKAEELLRRGLALTVLSHDDRICLSYELAFLFESTGVVDQAIGLYREVREANPAFHDVSHRLSVLAGEELADIIELELEEGN